jgi:hypothetical protein
MQALQTTATPQGFLDKPFVVSYMTTLAQFEALTDQAVALDNDADFILRSIYLALNVGLNFSSLTAFTFNFAGPEDYYYQTSQIPSFVFSQNSGQPFPILPEVHYPAGGQIKLNITDITYRVTGTPTTYGIFFVGVKRFRIQQ